MAPRVSGELTLLGDSLTTTNGEGCYTFEQFMDGFAWWSLGHEGRSRDFDAAIYDSLVGALEVNPLSEGHWQQVLTAVNQWQALSPEKNIDAPALANAAVLAAAVDTIKISLGSIIEEYTIKEGSFMRFDIEKIVSMYHVLALSGGVTSVQALPLLCHAVLPFVFPAIDVDVTPINDAGEYLNHLSRTQMSLSATNPLLIGKLGAILVASATKGAGAPISPQFPVVSKLVQLMELGRAHPGFFDDHRDAAHDGSLFGRTLGETGALIAGALNHESSETVLPETTYQHFAQGLSTKFDLRVSYRLVPTEDDPELRERLLSAVNCVEGLAFWLFRAGAPRDFLLHTYQLSALQAAEGRVLSDEHIDVVIRGLEKAQGFLSPELDRESLRADLVMHRAQIYGEYLRAVHPYRYEGTQWIDLPSDDDGRNFIGIIRELPSLTNDIDISWVCHLLCPAAFAPLAAGGEYYLGVTSYEDYNARVKDLYVWATGEPDDCYQASLLMMQYVLSGHSLDNLKNIEASRELPVRSLVTFLALLGVTHPGLSQVLRDEGCETLPGNHYATNDFQSMMLILEGLAHGRAGWATAGLLPLIESVQITPDSASMPRFVVPTELFAPGVSAIRVGSKNDPNVSIGLPIRMIYAEAVIDNFGQDSKVG